MSDQPSPVPQKRIRHAFNAKVRIDQLQVQLFREGPAAVTVQSIERLAQCFLGMEQSPKYAEFLAAARQHGIVCTIVVAVEEPANDIIAKGN